VQTFGILNGFHNDEYFFSDFPGKSISRVREITEKSRKEIYLLVNTGVIEKSLFIIFSFQCFLASRLPFLYSTTRIEIQFETKTNPVTPRAEGDVQIVPF